MKNANIKYCSTIEQEQPLSADTVLPEQLMQYEDLIILRVKEVLKMLKISRSSFYNKLNKKSKYYDPNFGPLIRIGKGAVGMRVSDLKRWLNNQPIKE